MTLLVDSRGLPFESFISSSSSSVFLTLSPWEGRSEKFFSYLSRFHSSLCSIDRHFTIRLCKAFTLKSSFDVTACINRVALRFDALSCLEAIFP